MLQLEDRSDQELPDSDVRGVVFGHHQPNIMRESSFSYLKPTRICDIDQTSINLEKAINPPGAERLHFADGPDLAVLVVVSSAPRLDVVIT